MQQKKSSCFLPLNHFNRKKLCSLLEQLIEARNAQATFNASGTVAAASRVLMKIVPEIFHCLTLRVSLTSFKGINGKNRTMC